MPDGINFNIDFNVHDDDIQKLNNEIKEVSKSLDAFLKTQNNDTISKGVKELKKSLKEAKDVYKELHKAAQTGLFSEKDIENAKHFEDRLRKIQQLLTNVKAMSEGISLGAVTNEGFTVPIRNIRSYIKKTNPSDKEAKLNIAALKATSDILKKREEELNKISPQSGNLLRNDILKKAIEATRMPELSSAILQDKDITKKIIKEASATGFLGKKTMNRLFKDSSKSIILDKVQDVLKEQFKQYEKIFPNQSELQKLVEKVAIENGKILNKTLRTSGQQALLDKVVKKSVDALSNSFSEYNKRLQREYINKMQTKLSSLTPAKTDISKLSLSGKGIKSSSIVSNNLLDKMKKNYESSQKELPYIKGYEVLAKLKADGDKQGVKFVEKLLRYDMPLGTSRGQLVSKIKQIRQENKKARDTRHKISFVKALLVANMQEELKFIEKLKKYNLPETATRGQLTRKLKQIRQANSKARAERRKLLELEQQIEKERHLKAMNNVNLATAITLKPEDKTLGSSMLYMRKLLDPSTYKGGTVPKLNSRMYEQMTKYAFMSAQRLSERTQNDSFIKLYRKYFEERFRGIDAIASTKVPGTLKKSIMNKLGKNDPEAKKHLKEIIDAYTNAVTNNLLRLAKTSRLKVLKSSKDIAEAINKGLKKFNLEGDTSLGWDAVHEPTSTVNNGGLGKLLVSGLDGGVLRDFAPRDKKSDRHGMVSIEMGEQAYFLSKSLNKEKKSLTELLLTVFKLDLAYNNLFGKKRPKTLKGALHNAYQDLRRLIASIPNVVNSFHFLFTKLAFSFSRVAYGIRTISFELGMLKAVFMGTIGLATKKAMELSQTIIQMTEIQRKARISLEGVFKDTETAKNIIDFSRKYAVQTPATFQETTQMAKSFGFIPAVKQMILESSKDRKELNKVLKKLSFITIGLGVTKPEQGISGATFALREALAGQFRSLRQRFELPMGAISQSVGMSETEMKKNPLKVIEALNKFLKANVGENTIKRLSHTFTVQMNNIGDAIELIKVKIGDKGFYDYLVNQIERVSLAFQGMINFGDFDTIMGKVSKTLTKFTDSALTNFTNLLYELTRPTNLTKAEESARKAFIKKSANQGRELMKTGDIKTTADLHQYIKYQLIIRDLTNYFIVLYKELSKVLNGISKELVDTIHNLKKSDISLTRTLELVIKLSANAIKVMDFIGQGVLKLVNFLENLKLPPVIENIALLWALFPVAGANIIINVLRMFLTVMETIVSPTFVASVVEFFGALAGFVTSVLHAGGVYEALKIYQKGIKGAAVSATAAYKVEGTTLVGGGIETLIPILTDIVSSAAFLVTTMFTVVGLLESILGTENHVILDTVKAGFSIIRLTLTSIWQILKLIGSLIYNISSILIKGFTTILNFFDFAVGKALDSIVKGVVTIVSILQGLYRWWSNKDVKPTDNIMQAHNKYSGYLYNDTVYLRKMGLDFKNILYGKDASNETRQLLKDIRDTYPDVANAMRVVAVATNKLATLTDKNDISKQKTLIEKLISNVAELAMEKIANPLVNKSLVDYVSTAMAENEKNTKEIWDGLVSGKLATDISNWANGIVLKPDPKFTEAIDKMIEAEHGVKKSIETLTNEYIEQTNKITSNREALFEQTLNAKFSDLYNIQQQADKYVEGLKDNKLKAAQNALSQLDKKLEKEMDFMMVENIRKVKAYEQELKNIAKLGADATKEQILAAKTLAQKQIGELFKGITSMDKLPDNIVKNKDAIINKIYTSYADSMLEGFMKPIKDTFNSINEALGGIDGVFTNLISIVADTIAPGISNVFSWIANSLKEGIKKLLEALHLLGAAKSIYGYVKGFIGKFGLVSDAKKKIGYDKTKINIEKYMESFKKGSSGGGGGGKSALDALKEEKKLQIELLKLQGLKHTAAFVNAQMEHKMRVKQYEEQYKGNKKLLELAKKVEEARVKKEQLAIYKELNTILSSSKAIAISLRQNAFMGYTSEEYQQKLNDIAELKKRHFIDEKLAIELTAALENEKIDKIRENYHKLKQELFSGLQGNFANVSKSAKQRGIISYQQAGKFNELNQILEIKKQDDEARQRYEVQIEYINSLTEKEEQMLGYSKERLLTLAEQAEQARQQNVIYDQQMAILQARAQFDSGAASKFATMKYMEELPDAMDVIQNSTKDMLSSLHDGLVNVISGTKGAWKQMIADLKRMFLKMLAEIIVNSMFKKILGGMSGGGSKSSGIFGGLFSFFGFADGGIVTQPTLSLVGEGGMNEAIVPLPDGRSIPVDFRGSAPIKDTNKEEKPRPIHIINVVDPSIVDAGILNNKDTIINMVGNDIMTGGTVKQAIMYAK